MSKFKLIFLLTVTSLLFHSCTFNNEADKIGLRVASYNIRVDAGMDLESGNPWKIRKKPLAELIINNGFDIVGTQEGNFRQMDELIELLPGYGYVGYPYAGPQGKSHTASIVYKNELFEVTDKDVFWFSETPDIESIGWDADDTRICTWACMKHKESGREFYFLTSHFFWKNKIARENSGKVMVRKLREIVKDDLPVISTGDFNSELHTVQIQDILEVLKDSKNITETPPEGPEVTNLGGGNFEGEPVNRIDYIMVNDKVRVLTYKVLKDSYNNGRYPSDHLPVMCDVELNY